MVYNDKFCNLLNEQIKKSWDDNVIVRATDIETSTDESYLNLIVPWVTTKVFNKTNRDSNIIDVGCGCGYLTNAIYENDRNNITGVDISSGSIDYAKNKYPNVRFICDDICNINDKEKYDMCLAVMVLNNMADAPKFFEVAHNLLVNGGTMILVLPHPCFWPQQHLKNIDFAYSNEKYYEYLFATQGCQNYSSNVLYFHRKLETYLKYIKQSGFRIIDFHEITEISTKRNPDILCIELSCSSADKVYK